MDMIRCNRVINIMGKQSGYAKQTDTQTREMMTVCRHIKISTNNNAIFNPRRACAEGLRYFVCVCVSVHFRVLPCRAFRHATSGTSGFSGTMAVELLIRRFSKKCFVQKLDRHKLTETKSATLLHVQFFHIRSATRIHNVMTSACMEFHTCAHASVVTAYFQLPISESDTTNCSHILHKISCTTSLMVEANECAVTACTLIRATICLSKLPYTPACL